MIAFFAIGTLSAHWTVTIKNSQLRRFSGGCFVLARTLSYIQGAVPRKVLAIKLEDLLGTGS